jgi:serine/threonine protein kinase
MMRSISDDSVSKFVKDTDADINRMTHRDSGSPYVVPKDCTLTQVESNGGVVELVSCTHTQSSRARKTMVSGSGGATLKTVTVRGHESCYRPSRSAFVSVGVGPLTNELLVCLEVERVLRKAASERDLKRREATGRTGMCRSVSVVGISSMPGEPGVGTLVTGLVSGDLSKLPARYTDSIVPGEVVMGVLSQLLQGLLILKERAFSHGDLKLENVFYDMPPQSSGKVSVVLADFDKSSMFIGSKSAHDQTSTFVYGLSQKYPFGSWLLNLQSYAVTTSTTDNSDSELSTEPRFGFEGSSFKNMVVWRQAASRHSGRPYYASHDWYVFLLSMCSHPDWFKSLGGVTADRNGTTMLEMLLLVNFPRDSDYHTVLDRVVREAKSSKKRSIVSTLMILSSVAMQCDAMSSTCKFVDDWLVMHTRR